MHHRNLAKDKRNTVCEVVNDFGAIKHGGGNLLASCQTLTCATLVVIPPMDKCVRTPSTSLGTKKSGETNFYEQRQLIHRRQCKCEDRFSLTCRLVGNDEVVLVRGVLKGYQPSDEKRL